MGTTAEKLQRLLQTKADIRAAIIEKGQEVEEAAPFSSYAAKIRAIESGAFPPATEPLSASEFYARLRPADYPPFPEKTDKETFSWPSSVWSNGPLPDLAPNTLVLLFDNGSDIATQFGVTASVGEGNTFTVTLYEVISATESGEEVQEGTEWVFYSDGPVMLEHNATYQLNSDKSKLSPYFMLCITTPNARNKISFVGNEETVNTCVEARHYFADGVSPSMPSYKGFPSLKFVSVIGENLNAASFPSGAFENTPILVFFAPGLTATQGTQRMFYNCVDLLAVDFATSSTTSSGLATQNMFQFCKSLRGVPTKILNSGSLPLMFSGCTALQRVSISIAGTIVGAVGFTNTFRNCVYLESVEIKSPVRNLIVSSTAFTNCLSLRRLVFDAPRWTGNSIFIAGCNFDRSGLVELFASLPSITATTNKIFITGNPGVSDLTDADKALATDKGWTLVI